MHIAIKYDAVLVDSDGHIAGHDAGATLVRRLLRVFPGASVIGPGPRQCEGFDLIPLEFLDGDNTVVINMDVIDSAAVWRTLHRHTAEPKVMNFVWWSIWGFQHKVELASLAVSCGLFPTFANSERTATEVREIVSAWATQAISEKARITWVNLGIRLEHVQPRTEPSIPVVLYPAIYLSERKRPQLFLDVVERVQRRTPIKVEARLHESHLISETAMRLSRKDWAWVGPLTATREDYWHALARTTAFLATANDESYGLAYVEALVAGAVGVFPDRPWVRTLLPTNYPFIYHSAEQAEAMLYRAVTDTAACRADLDAAVGGSFVEWLRARHDDDKFERAIANKVTEWFGPVRISVPAA
ncbi:MAG: glycosyltransferase family 1 protein [Candidatus Nanopelagicales bacterium]